MDWRESFLDVFDPAVWLRMWRDPSTRPLVIMLLLNVLAWVAFAGFSYFVLAPLAKL